MINLVIFTLSSQETLFLNTEEWDNFFGTSGMKGATIFSLKLTTVYNLHGNAIFSTYLMIQEEQWTTSRYVVTFLTVKLRSLMQINRITTSEAWAHATILLWAILVNNDDTTASTVLGARIWYNRPQLQQCNMLNDFVAPKSTWKNEI